MEKPSTVNILAELEQFETSLEHFAPLVATYFKSMVTHGVPYDLARELTLEWHQLYWARIIGMAPRDNE